MANGHWSQKSNNERNFNYQSEMCKVLRVLHIFDFRWGWGHYINLSVPFNPLQVNTLKTIMIFSQP